MVFGALAVLGVFGVKKSPEKRGVHSGPKGASSAYLLFEHELCRKYRFSRALAVGLMPSNLPVGGVWGLSRFWAIWGKNDPKKKFPNMFGDTLGGYL